MNAASMIFAVAEAAKGALTRAGEAAGLVRPANGQSEAALSEGSDPDSFEAALARATAPGQDRPNGDAQTRSKPTQTDLTGGDGAQVINFAAFAAPPATPVAATLSVGTAPNGETGLETGPAGARDPATFGPQRAPQGAPQPTLVAPPTNALNSANPAQTGLPELSQSAIGEGASSEATTSEPLERQLAASLPVATAGGETRGPPAPATANTGASATGAPAVGAASEGTPGGNGRFGSNAGDGGSSNNGNSEQKQSGSGSSEAGLSVNASAAPRSAAPDARPAEALKTAEPSPTGDTPPAAETAKTARAEKAHPAPSPAASAETVAALSVAAAAKAASPAKGDAADPSSALGTLAPLEGGDPIAPPPGGTASLQSAAPASHAAAAPAPHAAARQPAGAQVASQILRRSDNGATSFDMRLDPPELGRVQVRMELEPGGGLRAHITAETASALAELMRGARELERNLANSGFTLADNGLTFDLNQRERQGGDQRALAGAADDGSRPISADAALDPNAPAPRAAVHGGWSSARVNIIA